MSESASTYPSSKFTSASPVTHGERINSIEIMGGVALLAYCWWISLVWFYPRPKVTQPSTVVSKDWIFWLR